MSLSNLAFGEINLSYDTENGFNTLINVEKLIFGISSSSILLIPYRSKQKLHLSDVLTNLDKYKHRAII